MKFYVLLSILAHLIPDKQGAYNMISTLKKTGLSALKSALLVQKQFNSFVGRQTIFNKGIILQYHSVRPLDDAATPDPGKNITVIPHVFEKQMIFIKKYFNVLSFDRFITCIQDGSNSEKIPLTITFDDGYYDNYLYAYPVLKKYNVPAIIYLTTDCIDNKSCLWPLELRYCILNSQKNILSLDSLKKEYSLNGRKKRQNVFADIKKHVLTLPRSQRDTIVAEVCQRSGIKKMGSLTRGMLTWDEVRQMHKDEIDFGSHTISHPSLPFIPLEEAEKEISLSKEIIEDHLNNSVIHFSYPNPGNLENVTPEIVELVKAAGYISATTSDKGCVQKGENLLTLKRKGIYHNLGSLTDFYFEIEKNIVLPLWILRYV